MLKNKFNVVLGAQAGSESKGKLTAYLVSKFQPEVLTMAASPNAGHTVIMHGGRSKFVTYHLPAAVVGSMGLYKPTIILGPSSVINVDTLLHEVQELRRGNIEFNLIVDYRSTIITPAMTKEEIRGLTKIGSTAQGVGMARIARIKRIDVQRAQDVKELGAHVGDSNSLLHSHLIKGSTILHESTQGFDLCLDHGIDPTYCTTRNITTAGALAEMGVSPRRLGHVYGVLRPYPIQVNNRDGFSGPYAEAREITWQEVNDNCGGPGNLEELTTTTKLPRRVFEFCWSRFMRFARINGPDYLCLQFANYLDWSCYGATDLRNLPQAVLAFVSRLEALSPVAYIGTGPDHSEMIDLQIDRG